VRLISLVWLAALPVAIWAADKVKPLKIRVGLWEVTTTIAHEKMPIPAALLEKLTPDQRARIQARMDAQKSDSGTTVTKECVTRKRLDQGSPFQPNRESCTRTVVTSASNQLNFRVECSDQGTKDIETIDIEAVDSETVRGSIQRSVTGDDSVNASSTFYAKWIRASCNTTR